MYTSTNEKNWKLENETESVTLLWLLENTFSDQQTLRF